MITESSLISTGVGLGAYVIDGIIKDKKIKEANGGKTDDKQPSNTLKRTATTLTVTALPTASLATQDARFEHTMDKYHQEYIQVEAQAYVDSMSDEELEETLQRVGLLEEDMTNSIDKTI